MNSPGSSQGPGKGSAPPSVVGEVSTELSHPPYSVNTHAAGALSSGPVKQVVTLSRSHAGPLPPASEFAAYESAKAGAAEWIMSEASLNSAHIREVEREGMRVAGRDALLFRMLPFAVVAMFLIVSTIIAFLNVWLGASGVAITLTTVVVVYLRGFGALDDGSEADESTEP